MKSRWRWDRVRDSRCRTGIASLPADPYRFRSDGGLRPMAYDNTDPRSLLAGAKAPPPVIDYADAETIEFHKIPPSETGPRSEEHTSELQSLMRISYAVFCLKKKKTNTQKPPKLTIDK